MDGGDEGSEKMIDTAMRTIALGFRAVKKTVVALWMLFGLALLAIWAGVGGWFLLWIGSLAFSAEWSQAIGQWGYDLYVEHTWVKIGAFIAFFCLIGLFVPASHVPSEGEAEETRKEAEERLRFLNNSLVAQRQREESQLGCR
jgi:hypothetical protein